MKIETTYEEVKSEYPEALKELENKLRSGTSKHKNKPMENLDYHFMIAEQIQGHSFGEMINSIGEEPKEETVDEIVKRRVDNSIAVLKGKIGRWRGSLRVDTLPSKVEQQYRESEEEQRKEEERFDNLSEEEKQKEMNEAIEELQKMGGFTMLGIRK